MPHPSKTQTHSGKPVVGVRLSADTSDSLSTVAGPPWEGIDGEKWMSPGGHRLWMAAHTRSQELAPFGLGSGWGWPWAQAQYVSLGSSRKVAGGWAGSGDLPWRVAFPGKTRSWPQGSDPGGVGGAGSGAAYILT